jgi:TPR repeat protein
MTAQPHGGHVRAAQYTVARFFQRIIPGQDGGGPCHVLLDQGHLISRFEIGNIHAHGIGVAEEFAEAPRLIRRAADQEYAYTQLSLGVCYVLCQGLARDTR